jgi:hypothetical protein
VPLTSVVWEPDGATLEVPLRLEHRALALLEQSDVWQAEPLARTRHELRRGHLRISGESLLEAIDPRELRRVLDAAVARAHDEATQARSRDSALAEAFLATLCEEPGE